MRSVELFAGAGGLLLGESLAGFSHDVAVEWEHNSCETLRENQARRHPLISGMTVMEGDVRDVEWGSYSDIDLLSGGPPCQPFSLGGLARAALDPRDMFPAMTTALERIAPRAFIVENVKGLLRESFNEYYSYILLRLQHPSLTARQNESWRDHAQRLAREHTNGVHDDLRYEVIPTSVDAADYGVPQHRHRVIIVGFRSDVNAKWSFPQPTHSGAALFATQADGSYWDKHKIAKKQRIISVNDIGDPLLRPWRTVRDALDNLPKPTGNGSKKYLNHILRMGARSYSGHTGSYIDAPSKALKAGVHGVPGGENMIRYPNGQVRYYTVREAARIQGFPDSYYFHGSWSEAMRQIGNAVPVRLAQVVASSVAVSLQEDSINKGLDLLTENGAENEMKEVGLVRS
jgi:DNA (cytosine-5)-methyltransferase 1